MNENDNRDINIALLIDVDNIAWKYTESILSELSKYGKITIRRMYGDWSQPRLRGWLRNGSRYSLTPIMQPNNTPGKNASDIGLIIDAMDILYTGQVQGFCIVSSDSDFNRLATRLREAGMTVIGMGEKKTAESFRASCERFVFLDVIRSELEDENLDEADAEDETDSEPAVEASSSGRKKTKTRTGKTVQPSEPEEIDDLDDYTDDEDDDPGTSRAAIEDTIIRMITDNDAEGKDTGLGEIGSRLVKIYPDFDIRNYGYSKLSSYLKDFDSLDVSTRNHAVWVSLRGTQIGDVERQIADIYHKHNTNVMNIGLLKDELQKVNPNLNATIKQSGVTKFSVFIQRKVSNVQFDGKNTATFDENAGIAKQSRSKSPKE